MNAPLSNDLVSPGDKRLLDVARACRETRHPRKFSMRLFSYDCKTPACALGNYAHRADLQNRFRLMPMGLALIDGRRALACDSEEIRDYFSLSIPEAGELFCSTGCNDAKTPRQAAEYIEFFVDRRRNLGRGFAAFRAATLSALDVTKEAK
jgi:hypothetical protein